MKGAALGAALLVGIAAPAAAEISPTSPVAQLHVVEPGDDNHRLFHGAVWLEVDKAQTNYRWGGLHCKGRELSAPSLALLAQALGSTLVVQLGYVASTYEDKAYRCVTSVTISKP